MVRHGETGFIVPVGDETALAAGIQALLENPTLRRQMGAQGRTVVERDFNAAINVPKMLDVMKAVVDRKRMIQKQEKGKE
jgi:glycosyltransferase involved in cell wall biosynthesis